LATDRKMASEMKVTFVTTHYPPSVGFGGVCEASYGLSNALSGKGICVKVVTSDASEVSRIPFEAFAKMERSLLHIHPFRHTCSKRSCFSFGAKDIIKKLVRDSDVVHINGIYTHPATLGARYARRTGKPHVVAIRNGLDPWMMQIKRAKKILGFKLYVRADLQGATCIHATAQQEIEACMAMGVKGPFTIIPNGINPYKFTQLPDYECAEQLWPVLKDRTVVLFLSRLSKQKGLDMLVLAWDCIMKKHPEAFLVIGGPDYLGYSDVVRGLVQKSAFSDSVLFTGNVVGRKKLALYSRADLFVLPSYSENFGNVVAEALACGVPVVTTQATPWSELEKYNCGRWVPVHQDAILAALSELINMSSKERKEMGRRGKDFVETNYTWDMAARKMITVYHAMLNAHEIPLYPDPWSEH
jgi:glycosyltransferase involved in cell wall biosynthesis